MDATNNTYHRATIDDVASRAGVSIKTVSRVVNNEPNVRPATREAVLQAIKDLKYRPNASARRLAGNRSFLFALVYDDPSAYINATANYITNVQGGALKKAREAGYDLLIHPCDYHDPGVVDEIRVLVEHSRIDGLLLTPPLAEVKPIVRMLRDTETPVIRVSPGKVRGYDAVGTNDREVSAEMTRYLASLGHERIAFIRGHPHHRALAGREQGYLDGMSQSGLRVQKSLVQQGDNSFESGVEVAKRLLRMKNLPTAVFAGNDDMAAGVLQVAGGLGIKVPEQLSVAGFDNVPISRQVWPTLTTIHQPTFELAEKATELLFQLIRGEKLTGRTQIDSSLVIRDSTAPPRE
ncbi:MAG: LacI family DNA-binding transcriptional regulator [Xanthomonadales bacterium]|nr:LacI family DNA-binding transcriptional regulator [Xanthomonadales bacterium]